MRRTGKMYSRKRTDQTIVFIGVIDSMETDKTIKSGKHEIIERKIDRHFRYLDRFFSNLGQISCIINWKSWDHARYISESFNILHIDMIIGMDTLLFLHKLHKEYWLSYKQMGNMLGIDRMTVYRYIRADHLSQYQDLKLKRAIATWLTRIQDDFINTYKK